MWKSLSEIARQLKDSAKKVQLIYAFNGNGKTDFLGFPQWSDLLPENKETYFNRIIHFTSHSTLANESVSEPSPQEKRTVKLLLEHLTNNYGFWKEQ